MEDFNFWAPTPRELKLAEGEIHLWRAHLDCCDAVFREFQSTLAVDERARADRYFFPVDRTRFVITRGVLRELLSRYLGCAPREIQFEYTLLGKPFLRSEFVHQPIRFNVSHSHGLALFAFGLGRDLGVDVELVRSDFGGEE
ncbi:MAG: phosphopantetheine-protein transferase, partial [Acidobacteria bacterium]